MPNCKDVLAAMERLAPVSLAEEWDNVGLLVENSGEITGILAALDITPAVIAEAKAKGCNLVVSHHPVIFGGLKRLTPDHPACMLLAAGMGAICMHTNLDAASGGVNDTLAGLLGMENPTAFVPCGRIGDVNTDTAALAQRCVEVLGAAVKVVDSGKPVRRLAVVSGAGGSMLADAIAAGADALVTGEASHHVALDAQLAGITLIAAGHFATERPVVPVMADYLKQEFPGLPVELSSADADPYTYQL